MENSKINRLATFCEQTWSLLSTDEKERYYYDHGIIGFIEDCMTILNISDKEVTVDDIDFIVDRLYDLDMEDSTETEGDN